MNDLQREAMTVLAEVWALSPDVRLGQLMAHLEFLSQVHDGKGLGYIKDDELIAILYRHGAELTARVEILIKEAAAGKLSARLCPPRSQQDMSRQTETSARAGGALRKCG